MTKAKSLGREKAKENTFISLGTRPEEYEPVYYKIFRQTSNCQLCGQHIGYDFLLKHKSNEAKNLYVGSDCIVTFCRTYLPNIVDSMIRKMEMEMDRLVEEEKAKVFNEVNPTFEADYTRLEKSMREILLKYNTRYEFISGKKKIPVFETIIEARTDFRKKRYTTKPKVDEIYDALKELDSGRFEEKIKEYSESLSAKKTIKEDLEGKEGKVNKEFYALYFQYANYLGWNKTPSEESPALTKIEKEVFLSAVEEYLAHRTRNKKKLSKNRDYVVESIRKRMSDPLSVSLVEPDKHPFLYLNGEKDKEAVSSHKAYVDLYRLYYGYGIKDLAEEYGLASLKQVLGLKNEEIVVIGKAENYYPFKNTAILFKTEEDAKRFLDNIHSFIESKISEIDEYLKSEDLATEKFH